MAVLKLRRKKSSDFIFSLLFHSILILLRVCVCMISFVISGITRSVFCYFFYYSLSGLSHLRLQ